MKPLLISYVWMAVCSALSAAAQLQQPRLEIQPQQSKEWVRLNTSVHSNTVLTLQGSSNLLDWRTVATLHDAAYGYPDPHSKFLSQQFYRIHALTRVATNDWKNQILFPNEPFRSLESFGVSWVKFAIILNDPRRVYYQHGIDWLFHYDFAVARLEGFRGMDRAQFDAISLHRTNQQVVLGAVLFAPGANFVEYGIQFVGLDPYAPEEVRRWFELVKATVYAPEGGRAYYMPVFEQMQSALANADFLASKGIEIATMDRWVAANHCYSPGWTVGRLKYFTASEIDEAFADGRLRPEDILLTDGVPAETPLVAGIISLTPSTPNSHVAILAQSFGIPFVHLSDPEERARVQQLAGRKIVLRTSVFYRHCEIKLLDVEDTLSAEAEAELLALKRPEPINYTPKAEFGALSASTDTLTPTDIQYFGGKAANYGLLRRWIPDNCPPAIALSFDLWDAFLDQSLPGMGTLRSEITGRLSPYTNYPPDIPSLKANLAEIRDLFRHTAQFTSAQQQALTNTLAVFNPSRKIRFRSSTNVEDSDTFTGAGLYDSYSGCLLDDLDGDAVGPSHCDSTEDNERGVFRAIQRVYASFYNDNAFLERLRHGVNETEVGMGVLVHHSFPDEEELANGVATFRCVFGATTTNLIGTMVTQRGATPVANPDGTSMPEVMGAVNLGSFDDYNIEQRSSLVPLGDYVLAYPDEYAAFTAVFTSVAYGFSQFYPMRNDFYLDFEYKKDVNLGLVVKQVRPIPAPWTTNRVVPFLIHEPTTYCTGQQEFGDAFSNHRLKVRWTVNTITARMSDASLAAGIYREGVLEYIAGATTRTLTGPPASWPEAATEVNGELLRDSWTTDSGGVDTRYWQLSTTVPRMVTGAQEPVLTQQDFWKTLSVTYATAVPTRAPYGQPATTTNETVLLVPCPELEPGAILQERTVTGSSGLTVVTRFYWPNPPAGPVPGYTAPLVHFVETRITGLTTDPIVLTNYFSQTYRPGHHNFDDEFIFEPRLEPGLPAATLAELNAANVQLLYINWRDFETWVIYALALDGTWRTL